jgi:hypothetical protein
VTRAFVEAIGLLGPGLAGWPQGRSVLSGRAAYQHSGTLMAPCELLPSAERRRASGPVNLALSVGREAFVAAGRDPAATAAVFASSAADGEILHRMCQTLASPERGVSPTSFLNSVHNAAAGYWSIATGCREPLTSLCAYDGTFAAGLLEASVQANAEERPVALICFDQPYPEPLHAARPVKDRFAVALLVAPSRSERALGAIDVRLTASAANETPMDDASLEALRAGNPAARSLPLLAALATSRSAEVVLPYVQYNHLAVRVAP